MCIILFRYSIASSLMPFSRVSAPYWYYENTVLRFVWYCLVFIQYSYYCDFVCLWLALCLCFKHRHVWVRFIHTKKITVACMSLLLLSIDLQRYWYFIMFYFKLKNGAMDKWCMVKWCNGEIHIMIGRFVSHKYWICSFVLFSNTTFFAAVKAIHIFQYLTTHKKYINRVYVIKPRDHQKTGL